MLVYILIRYGTVYYCLISGSYYKGECFLFIMKTCKGDMSKTLVKIPLW